MFVLYGFSLFPKRERERDTDTNITFHFLFILLYASPLLLNSSWILIFRLYSRCSHRWWAASWSWQPQGIPRCSRRHLSHSFERKREREKKKGEYKVQRKGRERERVIWHKKTRLKEWEDEHSSLAIQQALWHPATQPMLLSFLGENREKRGGRRKVKHKRTNLEAHSWYKLKVRFLSVVEEG